MRHLPNESATFRAQNEGAPSFDTTTVLLADIWREVAKSKSPHPMVRDYMRKRKRRSDMSPERTNAARRARRRMAQRRADIEAGRIT